MKKKVIIANWKMNGSYSFAINFSKKLFNYVKKDVEIILLPSFIYLYSMKNILQKKILLGSQDISFNKSGAFTGEISASMLVDIGCKYSLIGHSERRKLHMENNFIVAKKFKIAKLYGISSILCIGESLQEKERAREIEVIRKQIYAILDIIQPEEWGETIIAYEPIWAIGTGKFANPKHVQKVHIEIRNVLNEWSEFYTRNTRIVYGGSINSTNVINFLKLSEIDGFLIGNASLIFEEFLFIYKLCVKKYSNNLLKLNT